MIIRTYFRPATDRRGARIRARRDGGGRTASMPYDTSLSSEAAHRIAAEKLLEKDHLSMDLTPTEGNGDSSWTFLATPRVENLVNLTPWEIRVVNVQENGMQKTICIPPSGESASVISHEELDRTVNGIPVYRPQRPRTIGLPRATPGKLFLVLGAVRRANPRRKDLLSPFDLIKDAEGIVVGCSGLIMNR